MEEKKNFKQILAEQYKRGELPILGRKDTFEFACVQCGECCRDREDILLNPFDVFRLCKAKEMSAADFFDKYCELYPGESSKLPLAIIKFRPVYDFNNRIIGTRCPFLGKKDNLYYCRVHKDKPFVCFSFPLGRVQMKEGKPEYILPTPEGSCAGAAKAKAEGITQVVEDWMFGKEKLDREEKYNEIFSGFLENYRSWIDVNKLAGTEKALPIYKKWFGMVGELLYANYDFATGEIEFLDQLKANIEAIEVISKLIVAECTVLIDLRPKEK